jgi:hypothetical protein
MPVSISSARPSRPLDLHAENALRKDPVGDETNARGKQVKSPSRAPLRQLSFA